MVRNSNSGNTGPKITLMRGGGGGSRPGSNSNNALDSLDIAGKTSSGAGSGTQDSNEDAEAKYAAARARIFGLSAEGATGTSAGTSPAPTEGVGGVAASNRADPTSAANSGARQYRLWCPTRGRYCCRGYYKERQE